MYKKPETETQPMQAAGVLCVSGDGRVSVDNTELTDEKLF